MTLDKLRELANVTTQGATLDSLARAGESLGFTTRGVQCTYEPMLGFELPFIAHWEGYHFVVVYGASKRHVWVATFVIQMLGIVPPVIIQNILGVIVHENVNLLMVFIYFTIIFLYNVKLTLLLIAFVIPIVALTVLVTPKIKNYAREVFSVSTEAKSFLMEALGGVETVKGMGIERPLRLKWEKKYASALDVQYRAQVGYVMQSNLLFSGTIADNIACGDELSDRLKIEAVARTADAHAFISKMPKGYEQVVGERGMGLSGGQIQCLCIARALYRDPRLLIFDEATSALDTQSESHIIGNMHEILKGRTAVIIAHRLSTIMRADKILVLHLGAIVEQGRHEELVEGKQDMYYQLVQKQLSAA